MTTAATMIFSGTVIMSWCSRHQDKTPHRYQPESKSKLVCVICESEAKHETAANLSKLPAMSS